MDVGEMVEWGFERVLIRLEENNDFRKRNMSVKKSISR